MIATRFAERGVRWPWIAAIWAAFGLVDASQTILVMHAEGRHQPWFPLFATEFAIWLPWALATPSIVRLARSHPIVRAASVRTFTVHVAALAIVSAVTEAWSAWLQVLFNPWGNRTWPTFIDTFRTALIFQAFTFLVVYALILTVTHLADARERIARQATESARLAEQLATAQLAALRGQMEPHFMYNTLNAVTGLVRDRRNNEALSMIVGLSEFLRRASEDSHRSQVTLAEEVDYLQRYLQIQQVRFGDRLRTRLDIPPDLLSAMVPNLLLQPLAENAIKHGIARRVLGGTVAVSAVRQDGDLLITIQNDGPARDGDADATHVGVGIANLSSDPARRSIRAAASSRGCGRHGSGGSSALHGGLKTLMDDPRPNRLRILVVDDEELARRNLTVLLERDHDVVSIAECASGMEAVEAIRRSAYDLVFLDVQMPECDGFDVLEMLGGNVPTTIVFVTAYQEHALRAFEAGALDYLLKPFDDARLERALCRAKDKIAHYAPQASRPMDQLVVKSRGQVLFVDVADIDWIEAAGYYACLHVGGATHLLRRPLSELQVDLGGARFVRIHRSVIVNLDRIRALELHAEGDYEVVLKSGERLRLSRRFRRSLQERLGQPLGL